MNLYSCAGCGRHFTEPNRAAHDSCGESPMRFPDVTEMGKVDISGRKFTVYLVDDEYDGMDDDHDSDHATGNCECPCQAPMEVVREAAWRPSA